VSTTLDEFRGESSNDEPRSTWRHFYVAGAQQLLLVRPTQQEPIPLRCGDLAILLRGAHLAHVTNQREDLESSTGDGDVAPSLYGAFELPMGNTNPLLHALPGCLVVRSRDASQCFRELSKVLLAAAREPRPGQQIVINALASSLLAFALCEHAYQTHMSRGIFAALLDSRIARVLHAVHERSGENWNIRSMASLAGMSRSTFAVHFSMIVGVPPMRYVMSWRIGQAKQLLRDNRLSVSKVAEMLGYSSEAAFRKLFKRVEGIGPGQARAEARLHHPSVAVRRVPAEFAQLTRS
jgi:AraC-like DNA-binding protein